MHGVMIAIEYSYKLDRKNILFYGVNYVGRLLLRQLHILFAMNVLLEYFYFDTRNFYVGITIYKIISI